MKRRITHIILVFLQHFCTSICENITTSSSKIPLYLGGYFPMPGSSYDGSGFIPATQMALDHINERDDILPEYELKMIVNNSGVGTDKEKIIFFIRNEFQTILPHNINDSQRKNHWPSGIFCAFHVYMTILTLSATIKTNNREKKRNIFSGKLNMFLPQNWLGRSNPSISFHC